MLLKNALVVLGLAILLFGRVQGEPLASPTSVPLVQHSSATASTSELQTSSDPVVDVLKAQLAEMRRSEDRLLSTVLWTLSTVAAIAILLSAFSWWTSNKLHQQDLQKLQEEVLANVTRQMSAHITKQVDALSNSQSQLGSRLQADAIAFTMGQVAALKLSVNDFQWAIRASLRQADSGRQSDTNHVIEAIKTIAGAVRQAKILGASIDEGLLNDAQDLSLKSEPSSEHSRDLLQAISDYKSPR